jgi:hypothetical protein
LASLPARNRLTASDPISRLSDLGSNGIDFIVERTFEGGNRLSSDRPQQTQMFGSQASNGPVLMGEQSHSDLYGKCRVAADLPNGNSGLAAHRLHVVVEAMPQRLESTARRWPEFSKSFYGSRPNRTRLIEQPTHKFIN